MSDIEQFRDELGRMRNSVIRDFTKECLSRAYEHFWLRPSSSTGKYHLPDEFSKGGLIKHTKRVCRAAEILMRASSASINHDVVISACILHDICKYGDNIIGTEHTVSNHPQLASKLLKSIPIEFPEKYLIINAVERHMGKWGFSKPKSVEDRIVYFSDIIATNYIP